MTSDQIIEALKQVKYPGFSRDIVSFGLVRSAAWVEGTAKVSLSLTTADPKVPLQLKNEVDRCLRALPEIKETIIDIAVAQPKPAGAAGGGGAAAAGNAPTGIQLSIAVASGKGGVGKSTFAVNLACAAAQLLAAQGRPGRVGLMDCDIYGPSVPLMIGAAGMPLTEGNTLIPREAHGVKVMSIGFFVDLNTPLPWRGPRITQAIQQFVQNVKWGELDLLLIDLPPGTGDAHLTLVQSLPLDGAVVVTTPQLAATQVARKGALMFTKVNVPLLGVAENMSHFVDDTGKRHHVFGQGGGAKTAESLGTGLLGQVPLLPEIRECGDSGTPVVVAQPDGEAAAVFRKIAQVLLETKKK